MTSWRLSSFLSRRLSEFWRAGVACLGPCRLPDGLRARAPRARGARARRHRTHWHRPRAGVRGLAGGPVPGGAGHCAAPAAARDDGSREPRGRRDGGGREARGGKAAAARRAGAARALDARQGRGSAGARAARRGAPDRVARARRALTLPEQQGTRASPPPPQSSVLFLWAQQDTTRGTGRGGRWACREGGGLRARAGRAGVQALLPGGRPLSAQPRARGARHPSLALSLWREGCVRRRAPRVKAAFNGRDPKVPVPPPSCFPRPQPDRGAGAWCRWTSCRRASGWRWSRRA